MITSIIAANRHERRIITAASVAVLALSSIAHAQEGGGTADEAKAMLSKAATAVKEDEAKAVEAFNKGEGGFLHRDLYVFCGDLKTGKISASANPNGEVVIRASKTSRRHSEIIDVLVVNFGRWGVRFPSRAGGAGATPSSGVRPARLNLTLLLRVVSNAAA